MPLSLHHWMALPAAVATALALGSPPAARAMQPPDPASPLRAAVPGRGAPAAQPGSELAQVAQAPSEAARLLFDEGIAALTRGRLDAACDYFERSLEVAPAAHTLLQLGQCAQRDRRLLAARALFERALDEGLRVQDPTARQAYTDAARRELLLVAKRVPTLVVLGPPSEAGRVHLIRLADSGESGADTAGTQEITVFGEGLPLDPGRYALETAWRGDSKRGPSFLVAEGLQTTQAAPEQPGSAAPMAPSVHPSDPRDKVTARSSPTGWASIGAGPLFIASLGLGFVGVGGVFGYAAHQTAEDLRRDCPALRQCDPGLQTLETRARNQSVAADLLVITGLAAVAGGVVWALEQSTTPSTVAIVGTPQSWTVQARLGF